MSLIYPADIPKEREGERGRAVLAVAHQDADAVIYWHMDGHYLGSTYAPAGMKYCGLIA